MNKVQKKHAIAFDNYYVQIYGDRWPTLKAALEKSTKHVALVNKYASSEMLGAEVVSHVGTKYERNNHFELPCFTLIGQLQDHLLEPSILDMPLDESLNDMTLDDMSLDSVPRGVGKEVVEVYDKDALERFPLPPRDVNNIALYYLMDAASLFPVQSLRLAPGDSVLDMCAAPGGKSVGICQYLDLDCDRIQLSANDISPDRRIRLNNVLNTYLPSCKRGAVRIVGMDATLMARNGHYESEYDKVLIDAPCSSERHVIHRRFYHTWSIQSINKNVKRQRHLLEAALRSVKLGGTIVYSTCAINNEENDGVLRSLLHKHAATIRIVRHKTLPLAEKTRFGHIVLPDKDGYGPLFFAIIKKVL